jgi:hypothetical protein
MTRTLCGAKTKAGTPCQKSPINGGPRCQTHGGGSPQAKAKAIERVALGKARKHLDALGRTVDPVTDPITELEMLAGEAVTLTRLLRGAVSRLESVRWDGEYVGEQVRGEVQAYLSSMARTESILAKIVGLNLEERRVKFQEAQSRMIVACMTACLDHLKLSEPRKQAALHVLIQELRKYDEHSGQLLELPPPTIDGTAEEET